MDRIGLTAVFTCPQFCVFADFLFPVANGIVCACDALRCGRNYQLALQRRESFYCAAQLQCVDLNGVWSSESVSGEHLGSHLDAGAETLLDRRYSIPAALAQSSTPALKCFSNRVDLRACTERQGRTAAVRLV